MSDYLQDERVKAARARVAGIVANYVVSKGDQDYKRALDALCEAVVAAVSGPARTPEEHWRRDATVQRLLAEHEQAVLVLAHNSGPQRPEDHGTQQRIIDALCEAVSGAGIATQKPWCQGCGENAATCFGESGEGDHIGPLYCCDNCCGHGDGSDDGCKPVAALPAARPQGTATGAEHFDYEVGSGGPVCACAKCASPPSPGVSRADVEALPRYGQARDFEDYPVGGVHPKPIGEWLSREEVLSLFSPAPANTQETDR